MSALLVAQVENLRAGERRGQVSDATVLLRQRMLLSRRIVELLTTLRASALQSLVETGALAPRVVLRSEYLSIGWNWCADERPPSNACHPTETTERPPNGDPSSVASCSS